MKRVSTDRLKVLFKEVAGRAGLPKDFSVHSLRHTTAIMMSARGASPVRIKTWLRHKPLPWLKTGVSVFLHKTHLFGGTVFRDEVPNEV